MKAALVSSPKNSAGVPVSKKSVLPGILKKENKAPVKNLSVRFAPLVDADVHVVVDQYQFLERGTNNFVMDPVLRETGGRQVLAHPKYSPGVTAIMAEDAELDLERQCEDQLMAEGFSKGAAAGTDIFGGGETSWIGRAINSLVCAPRKALAGLAVWEQTPSEIGGVPIKIKEGLEEEDDEDEDDEGDDEDEDDDDDDDDEEEEDDDDDEDDEEEESSDEESCYAVTK